MSVHAELPFERFRYWQGQLVRARDLEDQLAEVERLTRWHNRAVHDAFGVRFGFGVTLVEAADPPRVRIDCGVAFDCSGAMLVLQRPRELRLAPLEPGESVVLVLRSRGRAAGCGGSLWEDDLTFEWARRFHGDPRAGVGLTRVSRDLSGEATTLDPSIRAVTRALARPRLGWGATIPGLAPWEPWEGGVQTRIETSGAGFTRIPAYFATLIATRKASITLPFFLAHVADPALTEFTFRLFLFPSIKDRERGIGFPEVARNLGLVVCWLACQPLEFVPPACPGQRRAPPACGPAERDAE